MVITTAFDVGMRVNFPLNFRKGIFCGKIVGYSIFDDLGIFYSIKADHDENVYVIKETDLI